MKKNSHCEVKRILHMELLLRVIVSNVILFGNFSGLQNNYGHNICLVRPRIYSDENTLCLYQTNVFVYFQCGTGLCLRAGALAVHKVA
jgi:hypothetical protein